jgi:hypothetical protein
MPNPTPQPAAPPKRRWHQYSLRTLLLLPLVLALVLSVIYSWPYVQRRYIVWQLQEYVDKDLRKLPKEEQSRVKDWLEKLIGKNDDQPRLLHNVDYPGIGRKMLVVEAGERNVLYGSGRLSLAWWPCSIEAVDSWGRATHIDTLRVGNSLYSASYVESLHGFACLMLQTDEDVDHYAKRYYYRISDGTAEIMRIEKTDGTLCTGWTFDLPPESLSISSLLESPDRVQQLRGLAQCLFRSPFVLMQIDDKTRQRLAELTNSPDPWISEEAKMVLEVAKKK